MQLGSVQEFLESADAARITGLTPASINLAANAGRIRVSARTKRGGRLFRREDVERFAAERAARRRLREEKS
jgi:helix-turn-helix protein